MRIYKSLRDFVLFCFRVNWVLIKLGFDVILVIRQSEALKNMLAIRLSDETEKRITDLAQRTGRSKSYYVRKAIESFLEDQEDYLSAISRLEERNDRVTLEEVKRLVEEKN